MAEQNPTAAKPADPKPAAKPAAARYVTTRDVDHNQKRYAEGKPITFREGDEAARDALLECGAIAKASGKGESEADAD